MAYVNRVMLMGNLTRDPQLRQTPGGTAVADLGLAISDKYTNKAGEAVETTCFVDIVVWDRQAETCGQYLRKGSPVMVEGHLQLDEWETKEGQKRSKLRVRAERVQFLGGARRSESGAESPRRPDRPPAGPASLEEDAAPLSDDTAV
jgi:single-strand DNA-binding protein